MKSLAEALKDIQKSNMTIDEKKEACFKLGLRKRDIEHLEFSGFFNGVLLTFGVEIECNVYRNAVSEHATDDFKFFYEGYNHIDNRDYFKFTTDSSVSGFSPIECVTPILDNNTDGFYALETCLRVLNAAGASVNSSCGLHVHVGLSGYNGEEIVNIYKNYQMLESLIDSFMSPSRRSTHWAKSIARYDFSMCHGAYDLMSVMHNDRYHKVNPMSYDRHGTVEFRQHQGSLSYEKISMWVNFCCKLVEWSKGHVLDGYVSDIHDVPFLNDEEKAFFEGRINYFAEREGRV